MKLLQISPNAMHWFVLVYNINCSIANVIIIDQVRHFIGFDFCVKSIKYNRPPFYSSTFKMCFFLTESPKSSPTKTPKKIKLEMYKLTREQKTFIKNDKQNKKLWDEAMESLSLGPVSITVYLVTSLCLEES